MRGVLSPKPQARVLLQYRASRGASAPALLTSYQERGKSAWLFGQGIWRWGFLPSAGEAGGRDLYPQFLLGLVRWIAEPAVRDRFQAAPAKRVFQNGEAISFTASLWDESYAPVSGASINVTLQSESGDSLDGGAARLSLQAGSEAGQYDGSRTALAPGAYRYRAVARRSETGEAIGSQEGRFWVETMGPEMARTWRDQDLLEQMARVSGGAAGTLARPSEVLDQIPRTMRRLGRIREFDVWNHWLLFALFALVLSTEWFLRRRRGLA